MRFRSWKKYDMSLFRFSLFWVLAIKTIRQASGLLLWCEKWRCISPGLTWCIIIRVYLRLWVRISRYANFCCRCCHRYNYFPDFNQRLALIWKSNSSNSHPLLSMNNRWHFVGQLCVYVGIRWFVVRASIVDVKQAKKILMTGKKGSGQRKWNNSFKGSGR